MRKLILPTFLISLFFIGLIGCNNPEQNFNFHEGDSLLVEGPTVLTLNPDTTTKDPADRVAASATYHSAYPTVKKTYEWSVTGNAQVESTVGYNDHENAMKATIKFPVMSADSTFYTVSVNDGDYKGTVRVKVCRDTELHDGWCAEQK